MDWEIELAFVIGKRARYVEEKDAMQYVAGYAICNDVSERRFQMKRNGQWMKGKSAETFGPLGPWLVTTDEIPDPSNLAMELKVNGEVKQTGSTATMIFSIPISSHTSPSSACWSRATWSRPARLRAWAR